MGISDIFILVIGWAKEIGNDRYILDLLLSIINVSVQTVDIVNDLPKMEFDL